MQRFLANMSGNAIDISFDMSQNSLGPFEYQLLSVLSDEPHNAYGITIMERIGERTGRSPNLGAIYKGLDRLREKGMVTSWWGEPTQERGGRRKRYYKIEAAGLEALHRTQATFGAFAPLLAPQGI
jgi:PadR family transcriptional regulator, regulatory protein PadR